MSKVKENSRPNPYPTLGYCNSKSIITESKPYAPNWGYEYNEYGFDKCYLLYKNLFILTEEHLRFCLYRFLYLNIDNERIGDLGTEAYYLASFLNRTSNGMMLSPLTSKQLTNTVSKAIDKFNLDYSNDSMMGGVLFVKKKFLFGLNPKTKQPYTHSEKMKIINTSRTKYNDDMFIETVEELMNDLDNKITQKNVAESMGCSIQTVRNKIPDEAKKLIKQHNKQVYYKITTERVEELVKHLTNNGRDRVSARMVKELTQIGNYDIIKRVVNKYSK